MGEQLVVRTVEGSKGVTVCDVEEGEGTGTYAVIEKQPDGSWLQVDTLET